MVLCSHSLPLHVQFVYDSAVRPFLAFGEVRVLGFRFQITMTMMIAMEIKSINKMKLGGLFDWDIQESEQFASSLVFLPRVPYITSCHIQSLGTPCITCG
jgi:hypothetical protein